MPPALLAFDTSAAQCAAALLSDGRCTTRVDPMARGQAEHLIGMLEALLSARGLGWRDLDALAVCTGPGNFTGIRIAVAAARGLALGLGRPAIGVTAFAAMREFAPDRPLDALVTAPRGGAYHQHFADGAESMARLLSAEALSARPKDDTAVLWLSDLDPAEHIAAVARVAAARLERNDTGPRPAPLYLRAADAAPPRDAAPIALP